MCDMSTVASRPACEAPHGLSMSQASCAAAVIFNLILGFDLRLCAGLSHTVVAVGALAAVLYGILQPSPTNPRTPLLNFDLAMVRPASTSDPLLNVHMYLSLNPYRCGGGLDCK